ncbi:uncharacterized protein LOC113492273 [Trichoplusia ni]|uniref:Uncharacterized protein LOC113492273 n=1 Tax=Trichoplusia ni TaxID=7111 RepID=A0A7E5VB50_TRINI|nr:uncharacterized protein LOC113492273 [Trichoplusia ni]
MHKTPRLRTSIRGSHKCLSYAGIELTRRSQFVVVKSTTRLSVQSFLNIVIVSAFGVKSPTSELARLEHRQSHNVQLMKASLYADTEMEDDASVSTGDQLVPVSAPLLAAPALQPPPALLQQEPPAEADAPDTEGRSAAAKHLESPHDTKTLDISWSINTCRLVAQAFIFFTTPVVRNLNFVSRLFHKHSSHKHKTPRLRTRIRGSHKRLSYARDLTKLQDVGDIWHLNHLAVSAVKSYLDWPFYIR